MNTELLKIQDELAILKQLMLLSAKNVLTIEDVSFLTGLSVARLYSLTSQHLIPYYKREQSRILYFDKKEIEEWMKGKMCSPPEKETDVIE